MAMNAPLAIFRSDLQALHTRLPVGAQVIAGDAGVSFRVWAPERRSVDVALETAGGVQHHALTKDDSGYFTGVVQQASAGSRYRFRLDGDSTYPDPASRY